MSCCARKTKKLSKKYNVIIFYGPIILQYSPICSNSDAVYLSPATPKYNGETKRANKTLYEEFYAHPIGKMRFEL